MSGPEVKRVSLPAPTSFALEGSALQIGGQLAEQLLREPLYRVLQAVPPPAHEDVLAGVLAEFCAVTVQLVGKRRLALMLRRMADCSESLTPAAVIAGHIPPDPEVH